VNKYKFELDYDQADSIVIQSLNTMLDCLQSDLKRTEESDRGYIFDSDKETDIKEIKKHIKSFKRVLKYYGGDL
jgi:hypothetical protein